MESLGVAIGFAALVALSFTLQRVRLAVARCTAAAGLRPPARRFVIGRAGILLSLFATGFWAASSFAPDFQLISVSLAGSVLLAWLASVGLGYASPFNGVRHRLLAELGAPVFLTSAILLGSAAFTAGVVEKQMVRDAWDAAPNHPPHLARETREGLQKLIGEWK